MNEVVSSITKYFENRMKTAVYGIFTFWWVVLHWEFFYTLFFVDQDKVFQKTHLLKNEYLKQRFYDYHYLSFWRYLVWSFILSSLLTYLMVWVIPRFILVPAYDKEQAYEADKRLIKLKYAQDVSKQTTRLENQETEKLKAATRRATQQKRVQAVDPAVLWQQEYDQLTTSPLYENFDQLIRSLYDYNGQVRTVGGTFRLNSKILAYADANNLVVYDRNKNIISLTDKGKFFVKQYQSDRG